MRRGRVVLGIAKLAGPTAVYAAIGGLVMGTRPGHYIIGSIVGHTVRRSSEYKRSYSEWLHLSADS